MSEKIQVFPGVSVPDVINGGSTDVENVSYYSRYFLALHGKYLPSYLFRQFCRWVLFPRSSHFGSPSFLGHVCHILSMCANEQMVRIYTWWAITLMAKFHALRNWFIEKFPTVPMGANSHFAGTKNAIASIVFSSGPLPTSGFWVNLHKFPEFLKYAIWVSLPIKLASIRAILPLNHFQVARPYLKNLLALNTNSFNPNTCFSRHMFPLLYYFFMSHLADLHFGQIRTSSVRGRQM